MEHDTRDKILKFHLFGTENIPRSVVTIVSEPLTSCAFLKIILQ